MEHNEEEARKELDKLFKNIKTIEDIIAIPFAIDDYIEEGFDVKNYITKYNWLVQKFYSKSI